MGIKRFEDLEVWQEARKVVRQIYDLTLTKSFERDWALRDQMRRAAISVMANIAEGFGRESNKEFVLFLNYASASATELKSHLYIALDSGYLSKSQFDSIASMLDSTGKQLTGFKKYLKNTKHG